MTKLHQIYKCEVCGNIVEVLHTGAGELVCCGEPMKLQEIKTEDQGQEKHVPVIEQTDNGVLVKVGEVAHPMEEEHFIEWIELEVDGRVYKKFLNPGDKPEAEFNIQGENLKAREYCSVHGLWSNS